MAELILYITAMAITPGPNTILSMANAARTGLRKGIRLNLGMLIGITAVTLLAWGTAELLYAIIPKAEMGMKAIAFAYLVFLAIKMLLPKSIEEGEGATFIQGLLLQLVNVKVYLLAITAITAYIMPLSGSAAETGLISLLIPAICFLSGLVWAIGGSLIKTFYLRHSRLLSILFSLLLLWCAASIFF